jgi:integrase
MPLYVQCGIREVPAVMQETDVLEAEELEALLAQVNTRCPTGARNYALLQLMAQAGLRCGEALAVRADWMRWERWQRNGDGGRVFVLRVPRDATKGKRPRAGIPLTAATRTAIEHWREKRAALGIRNGPLFCTISRGRRRAGFAKRARLSPGRSLNGRYVRELVARLARKAGIGRRVHPHMLRHTALTALYDERRDLRMVQEIAGHTTSRMTERYTHVHPVELADAMGALERDSAREGASGEAE